MSRPACATYGRAALLVLGDAALLVAAPQARGQVVGSADTTRPSIEYDAPYRAVELRASGRVLPTAIFLGGGGFATLLTPNPAAGGAPGDGSYLEDVQTAAQSMRPSGVAWRNLRATAASAWDFSSRWLGDGKSLATVRTLDILPVDLNSLMFHLEATLATRWVRNTIAS